MEQRYNLVMTIKTKTMKLFLLSSLIIALNSLVVYLTSIIAIHGIRKSISDSNYFLKKPFKLMFELVMWVCGIAIILTGIFIKANPDWLIIGGGIGIFLVGVFSDFKLHFLLRIAHYIAAIGGFSLLGLSFYFSFGNLNYTIIIAISALITGLFAKRRIWGLELTMAAEIFVGIFYYTYLLM
jgi:hydrogenase-4 membrane subunit HyfE